MNRYLTAMACSLLYLTAPFAVCAVTYTVTFDGPGIPLHLTAATPTGFDIAVAGGKAVFSKAAGTGNGFGILTTNFQLRGDFSVMVQMSRDNLNNRGMFFVFRCIPNHATARPIGYRSVRLYRPLVGYARI